MYGVIIKSVLVRHKIYSAGSLSAIKAKFNVKTQPELTIIPA